MKKFVKVQEVQPADVIVDNGWPYEVADVIVGELVVALERYSGMDKKSNYLIKPINTEILVVNLPADDSDG